MIAQRLTRRLFLIAAAATTSLFALYRSARALASLPAGDIDRPTAVDLQGGYLFFSAAESSFIEAAVARLIPADELGPGALEARVPLFIDRQLAGPYGRGDHFYLKGPYPVHPLKTQGWQLPAPAAVYRSAIAQADRYATDTRGAPFSGLSATVQDELLSAMESGSAVFNGDIGAQPFFELLLQNTLEGFFSDPLYAGNRDMVGWKLLGFPGARYDNRDFVAQHGAPYTLPPVGIFGRSDWTRPRT